MVATLKGCSPAMVGGLLGAADGPWPMLPLPACCSSPSGTGGIPDPLLYCRRKEQAVQTRPDLGLCPGVPPHWKDPGPPSAAGPDSSTWHPVPWTGSLWAGGGPRPIGEQTHTFSGCPRACTRERLNGTSSAPVPSVGAGSPSPLSLQGAGHLPPLADPLQSTTYSGSGAGQAGET